MTSMSKFALWCALFLMFTFTILVYISPSKPSNRSVLQIEEDDSPSAAGPSLSKHPVIGEAHEQVHRRVSISSSSFELPTYSTRHHTNSANDSNLDELSFMSAQTEIQKQRREVVDRVCKKYHPTPNTDIIKNPPWNIIVDEKYKMMYCFVQKVACTSWKKVFLVLSGKYNTTDSIPQFFTNRQGGKMLKYFTDYSESDRRRILRDYTKFMFSRHPFSRVLSAYRNKLAPDSTFQRAGKWQRRVGQKIIEKFRPTGDKQSSNSFDKSKYDLSFDEFVKFILTPRGPKGGNKHWRDLHVSCLPCLINYDIIGKIETLEDDARYILSKSGAREVVSFPSAEGSSPTNSSDPGLIQKYFTDLPSKDIKDLYNRYMIDFLMFDYHASVEGGLDVR